MTHNNQMDIPPPHTVLQKIMIGVVAPLIVASIIGSAALYVTVSKLALLVEHNDRRLNAFETDIRVQMNSYTSLKVSIAEHKEILNAIQNTLKDIKSSQNTINRKL